MIRFKFDVYRHGFMVRVMFENDKSLLSTFCSQLRVYENRYLHKEKKQIRLLKLSFSVFIPAIQSYGLQIGLYEDFMMHLRDRRVSDDEIHLNIIEVSDGALGHMHLSDGVQLKENQVPVVEFIRENSTGRTITLPIQTGAGKTAIALYMIAELRVRTAIILPAKLIEVWNKDLNWIYSNPEEVRVIQGGADLKDIIKLAKEGQLTSSILIFTINTIRDYLSVYEKTGDSNYGCLPADLYNTLGVGFSVVDESHENLHFHFRHDILTNVKHTLNLSATLESHDPFVNRMYELIYPIDTRYLKMEWVKYIDVVGIGYTLEEPTKVRCNGEMGYSHNMYEQWILADRTRTRNYLNMICRILVSRYHANYLPGQKVLVFISTVNLCKIAAKWIRHHPVLGNYKTSAYTGEHEDSVLHENDIVISTAIKSGTGKDIKGLVMVLNSIAINTREKSTQMLGRLRQIEALYPGVTPMYYELVCISIPKHMAYYHLKQRVFAPKVKSISTCRGGFVI